MTQEQNKKKRKIWKYIMLFTVTILTLTLILSSSNAACTYSDFATMVENKNGQHPYTIYEICEPLLCPVASKLFTYQMYDLQGSTDYGLNFMEQKSYYDNVTKTTTYYHEESGIDLPTFNTNLQTGKNKQVNNCYRIKIKGEWTSCQSESIPGKLWTTKEACLADNVICWNGYCYSEWIEWQWNKSNFAGEFSGTQSDTVNITLIPNNAHLWIEDSQVGHWQFEEDGIARDVTGMFHNGTLGNGSAETKPTFTTSGIVGGAYNFDGIDDIINISDRVDPDWGGLGNITIGFWLNMTQLVGTNAFIAKDKLGGVGTASFYVAYDGGVTLRFSTKNDSNARVNCDIASSNLDLNVWQFWTLTRNTNGSASWYKNGDLLSSCTNVPSGNLSTNGGSPLTLGATIDGANVLYEMNGTMDEVSFFNRSLRSDEIKDLYTHYLNNYTTFGNFTSNPLFFGRWANWTNISFVWQNGSEKTNLTVQYRTSNDNTTWLDWSSNLTNPQLITNISKYMQFLVTEFTDDTNVTSFLESLTVEYNLPPTWYTTETHYDETGKSELTELLYSTFNLTLTHNDDIAYVNASFYWNSTLPTFNFTTITDNGLNQTTFNATFIIEVNVSQNYTFYWNVTSVYSNGSEVNEFLTYDAYVFNTGLVDCSTTGGNETSVAVLNFTLWNEETPTENLTFDFRATFTVWGRTETRDNNETFSFDINSTLPTIRLCMSPNGTAWKTDAVIQYTGNDGIYAWRDYYILNQTLNTTGNISQNDIAFRLYTIPTALSDGITLVIQDSGGNPLENYYVKAVKYYPGDGERYTVEIDKANWDGETYMNLNKFETLYRFIIQQYQSIVWVTGDFKVSTDKLFITVSPTTFTDQWQNFDDIVVTLTNTTDSINATFAKSSTAITEVCLEVWQYTLRKNEQICKECSTSVSGNLNCYVGTENGTYVASLYSLQTGSVIKDIADTLTMELIAFDFQNKIGKYVGVWGAVMISGTLAAIGFINPAASMILAVIGLIVSWGLGMLKITYAIIISLIVILGIIISKMK